MYSLEVQLKWNTFSSLSSLFLFWCVCRKEFSGLFMKVLYLFLKVSPGIIYALENLQLGLRCTWRCVWDTCRIIFSSASIKTLSSCTLLKPSSLLYSIETLTHTHSRVCIHILHPLRLSHTHTHTHAHTHTHSRVCIHILYPLRLSDTFSWPQGWENSGLRKLEGSERKLRQSWEGRQFVTWWYVVFCCSGSQSCLTLCDPVDYNIPGFPVLHPHGFYIHWNRVGRSIALYAHGVYVFSKPPFLKKKIN